MQTPPRPILVPDRAKGSNATYFNNGFSVSIQTVYQTPGWAPWPSRAGESLSNGAFVQIGYEIINSTGYYSVSCGKTTQRRFLTAGRPTWFWEYFEPNGTGDLLRRYRPRTAPQAQTGATTPTPLSHRAEGTWKAYMNKRLLGTINLNANSSAECALCHWRVRPDQFKLLADAACYLQEPCILGEHTIPLPSGYSFTSYGRGSLYAASQSLRGARGRQPYQLLPGGLRPSCA